MNDSCHQLVQNHLSWAEGRAAVMQFVHPREPRLMELVLREIVRVLVYTKTIPPPKVPPLLRIRATSTMVTPFANSKMNSKKWKR